MIDEIPKLLRVSEVAEKLNCSLATVYSLIDSGHLGHHRCPGVRVSEQQLAAFLEETKRGRMPKPVKPNGTRPRLRHIKL
jgi:excisionase family DNA binding protein